MTCVSYITTVYIINEVCMSITSCLTTHIHSYNDMKTICSQHEQVQLVHSLLFQQTIKHRSIQQGPNTILVRYEPSGACDQHHNIYIAVSDVVVMSA